MVQAIDTSPPVRETWRLSLVNAASQTRNLHDAERSVGNPDLYRRLAVSYAPEYPADGTGDRTFDPCDADGSDITWPSTTADNLKFTPWGITHYRNCPTIGADPSAFAAETRRGLVERTSHLVEKVLWAGTLDVGTSLETIAAADGADSRRLASSSATLIDGTTAHDLTVALGLINEWVADTAGPYRMWVHAEPMVVPFVSFYGQGVRTDNGLGAGQFLGDHRFVFGTGYTGASSELTVAAGETWLIVTNPVRVILGEVSPGPNDPVAPFVDKSRNKVRVAAVREVSADWDLSVHGAIKVCLPGPGPTCP